MIEMITNLVLIPAIISALAAIAATRTGNKRIAGALVTLGIVAGFAGSYIGFAGLPAFPPTSSVQKLLYAPVLAGVILVVLHLAGVSARLLSGMAIILAIAGAAWILQRLLGRLEVVEWLLALCLVASAAVATVTTASASSSVLVARVANGAVALGLGLVLIFGGTATTGFYTLALAVAVGATILLELSGRRDGTATVISTAFLVTAVPLATQTLFLTDVSPLALIPLPACYLAVPIAQRLGWNQADGLVATVFTSAKVAAIAFLPAFAAAGISFASGGGSPY